MLQPPQQHRGPPPIAARAAHARPLLGRRSLRSSRGCIPPVGPAADALQTSPSRHRVVRHVTLVFRHSVTGRNRAATRGIDNAPDHAPMGVAMTGPESEMMTGESERFSGAFGRAPMMTLIWFVGVSSTIYLVWNAMLLSFLSIAFMDYSTSGFDWSKVADAGRGSLPLCIVASIGFAGLKLWPQRRHRLLGLTAIAFQTAMAIWVYADPVSPVVLLLSGQLS